MGEQHCVAVDHSIVMYLMGPDGQFIDFYTQLMTAPEMTERIAAVIRPKDTTPGWMKLLGFGK